LGVDLELQGPGSGLSFLRPALSGELAFGRGRPGLFWTLGGRVSAPLGSELSVDSVGPAADTRIRARAFESAAQVVGGYGFGSLALTAQAAAGLSYLRVEAVDSGLRALGHFDHFSPLLAAGLGLRWSVALGFALALRGELQWAGRPNRFKIGGQDVLEQSPLRFGGFAGVLWESSLSRGAR
jgi:hypothetical protein